MKRFVEGTDRGQSTLFAVIASRVLEVGASARTKYTDVLRRLCAVIRAIRWGRRSLLSGPVQECKRDP